MPSDLRVREAYLALRLREMRVQSRTLRWRGSALSYWRRWKASHAACLLTVTESGSSSWARRFAFSASSPAHQHQMDRQRAIRIRGTGVDLDRLSQLPFDTGSIPLVVPLHSRQRQASFTEIGLDLQRFRCGVPRFGHPTVRRKIMADDVAVGNARIGERIFWILRQGTTEILDRVFQTFLRSFVCSKNTAHAGTAC
jgi:hypothetical protein